jgi:integrase
MARSTVNKSLQMLKACLNFAYSKNRVTSDKAWRGVKPLKGAEKSRKLVLTADQVESLIDAAEPQALKDLVWAAFLTGARYGELVNARVRDLNGAFLKVDGKTGERDMHILGQAQEHFEKLAKGKKPNDLLLPDESGKLWGRAINRLFRKACVKAGLTKDNGLVEDVVFYTLRHSYATHVLDTGLQPSVVAENMGNSEKVLNGFYRKPVKGGASAKLLDLAAPRLKLVA